MRLAQTKIVATVGPACSDSGKLEQLIFNGVDVFRINTAHGDRQQHEAIFHTIRNVSAELNNPVGILIDLAGPKIRLGTLFTDPTECRLGDRFSFVRGDVTNSPNQFTCNYDRLIDELTVGEPVMLADGSVSMVVESKEEDAVRCRVTGGGIVRSRQGINLPGTQLTVPSMTERDLDNAAWAVKIGADFVSLSFVRSPREIAQLKEIAQSRVPQSPAPHVIAKIEKSDALDCLNEIVFEADGVMVARGDLGVEIDIAETPAAQKRIIATCQRYAKPVIVATQMLDSMQQSSRPTRAEVSDVANAILDGADACMLSGETAIGKYPIEAVTMMNRIMLATETSLRDEARGALPVPALSGIQPVTSAIVAGASQIAAQLFANLIVVASASGSTARVKAKLRDFTPVVGVSNRAATLRQMSLYWGVIPLPDAPSNNISELSRYIDRWGRETGRLSPGDRVVFVTGDVMMDGTHNTIRVQEVN